MKFLDATEPNSGFFFDPCKHTIYTHVTYICILDSEETMEV